MRSMLRILTVFVAAAPLAAQSDTSAVPRELVSALLAGYTGGTMVPTIIVGRAPDGMPAGLVPPGLTVIGGIQYAGGGARTPMVLLRSSDDPATLVDRLHEHFDRGGWEEFQYAGRGGFVGSSAERSMGMWCKDSVGVNIQASRRAAGGSYVQISHQPTGRASMCNMRMRAEMTSRMAGMIVLPTLRAPGGVRVTETGSSGGSDSRESRARAQTEMSATQLLNHFLDQLEKEDWMVSHKLGDANVAVATLQKKDATGKPMYASIWAARQASAIDLSLRVMVPGSGQGGAGFSTSIP